jgi:hypothetical protein
MPWGLAGAVADGGADPEAIGPAEDDGPPLPFDIDAEVD